MNKCDRALKLKEQGLETWQIAERIGSSARTVPSMINAARAKRELTIKEAQQKENGKFDD